MCFHSKQSKKAQDVENRFNAKVENIDDFLQTDHISGFNFPKTPVITNEDRRIITSMNWGLIPQWANDKSIQSKTLNAKIETIVEKPAFKDSVSNRCLIIADGFYEWKWLDAKGKVKDKYLIGIPNNDLYTYAGIYSSWINVENGMEIKTYSIITTEANSLMSKIHNIKKRMPVILKKDDENSWLKGESIEKFSYPYEVNLVAKNLTNFEQPSLFD